MKKVFVGLSGGIDSAVSAALLQKQGYDVTSVYMKNWSRDIASHHCPWREDLASARLVATQLGIPLKIYDFEKEYFTHITKYMIETYESGLTPNPDIMCNQKIKFESFYNKCLSEGADLVATGHYANIQRGQLMIAKDTNKDQTYFLYRINTAIADKLLFPLGKYKKPQVRKMAEKLKLPNAQRAESQGLCFVGNIPLRDFLSEFIKPKSGDIKIEQGDTIGQHHGAFAYTLGQRHGLGVGGGKPYYVYDIDTQKNIVWVTDNENSSLLNKTAFTFNDCKFWQEPEEGKVYGVRVRYRSKLKPATIHKVKKGYYKVTLKKPEKAITPGQSAVLYDKSIVVGGGVICK